MHNFNFCSSKISNCSYSKWLQIQIPALADYIVLSKEMLEDDFVIRCMGMSWPCGLPRQGTNAQLCVSQKLTNLLEKKNRCSKHWVFLILPCYDHKSPP